MKTNHVWVVESWWNTEFPRKYWKPTVGIGLDRDDGRRILKDWQLRNPDDKFRLTKYKPELSR